MTKILLIYPTIPKRGEIDRLSMNFTIPMGLLYVGTVLKKSGFEVKLLDAREKEDNFYKALEKELDDAICAGISAMSSQIKPALEIAEFIRDNKPEIKIVFGGAHPTFFPEQTCSDYLIDFAIFGEGELTFHELVKSLNDPEKYGKIDGLAYEEGGLVKLNPPREALEMDTLPPPSLEIAQVESYILKNIHGKTLRTLELNSSRGCPHRCAYCINTLVHKKKWRAKSAGKVLGEIGFYIEKFGVQHIHFLDENFFVNKKRVLEIIEGIVERGYDITWQTNVRVDYFKKGYLASDIIKKIRKSGCIQLNFGAESGSNKILKKIKKDATVEQLLEAVKVCEENDIIPNCSFMVGLPEETIEDMKLTIEVIKKIKKINPRSIIIGPQIFRPYPGGELYNECVELGFTDPSNLREWVKMDPYLSTGYVTVDDLPWIENKKFVEAVSLYTPFATQNPSRDKTLIVNLFIIISKIRWMVNFWAFPYEYKVFQNVREVFKKISNRIKLTEGNY
jgi:radical SAM superfamily enzyme YgiQ (UPF0313 family)